MAKHLLILLSFMSFICLNGQRLRIDTIKTYQATNIINTIQGGDTTCIIDGRHYSPKYCDLFNWNSSSFLQFNEEDPSLHFTTVYNLGDTLLYSVYCIDIEVTNFGPCRVFYPNGKIMIKGQYLFFGRRVKPYLVYENHNCKTGKWYYYNENCQLSKMEVYRRNKLTRTKEY